MRAARVVVAILTLSLLTLGAAVQASNLNFLEDAPATFFNATDKKLFKDTTIDVLNQAKDGESRSWSNADSGSSGEVKVLRTLPGENKCRELQITNRAAGRSASGRWVYCYEAGNDRWVVSPGVR